MKVSTTGWTYCAAENAWVADDHSWKFGNNGTPCPWCSREIGGYGFWAEGKTESKYPQFLLIWRQYCPHCKKNLILTRPAI